MKAYKLFRIKDNKLHPLFINRKQIIPMNEWLEAELHPTKGFAVRQGWHCTLAPVAPHLNMELKNGEKRIWVECEVEELEYYNRPESQGGTWVLAQKLKAVRLMEVNYEKI